MLKIIKNSLLIFTVLLLAACASEPVKNYFNDISLADSVMNKRGLECPKIEPRVVAELLKIGQSVTDAEILNNYSLTGCTIDGTLVLNNTVKRFVFEYGGVLFLEEGKTFACGPQCCASGFPYCSYRAQQ